MAEKFSLPSWAISDDEAESYIPEDGWFHSYVQYARECTDAPLIYHVATAYSILSCAAAKCSLEAVGEYGSHEQPFILWIGVIGSSGDRKSTALEIGRDVLTRARQVTDQPRAVFAGDGSQEAFHDLMCDSPNMIFFKDELSNLFDIRGTSYMKGFTSWLLELYSGKDRPRMLKSYRGNGDNGNGDSEAPKPKYTDEHIIERPRLNILGGIPPAILRQKASGADWHSGFLARFKLFGGMRGEAWRDQTIRDDRAEAALASWLHKVAWGSSCRIVLQGEAQKMLSRWVYERVEVPRMNQEWPDAVVSQNLRLQEFGSRIAGLYALTQQHKPLDGSRSRILVDTSTMDVVLRVLEGLRRTSLELFVDSATPIENREEKEVCSWIKAQPNGVSVNEILEHFKSTSRRSLYRYLRDLVDAGLLKKDKPLGRSRSSRVVYKAPSK